MNPSLTDHVRTVAEALEGDETLEDRGVLEHRGRGYRGQAEPGGSLRPHAARVTRPDGNVR
jgi:hypothetical protein